MVGSVAAQHRGQILVTCSVATTELNGEFSMLERIASFITIFLDNQLLIIRKNSKSWTFKLKTEQIVVYHKWPHIISKYQYSLLRWVRNETPQLSMKCILNIARWIQPNWRIIGGAHYLSFVINICCCNKRLGPSVVSCTNRLEFLYMIGRQNTQSYNAHQS